jgi:hypothetical protein
MTRHMQHGTGGRWSFTTSELVLAAEFSGIDRKGDGQILANALSGDLPGESPDTGVAQTIIMRLGEDS